MKKFVSFLLGLFLIAALIGFSDAGAAALEITARLADTLLIARDTYYAIAPDHTLVGWGNNELNFLLEEDDPKSGTYLGAPISFANRRVVMEDCAAVYNNGGFCVLALDTGGTLYGWGGDMSGTLMNVSSTKRIKLLDGVVMAGAGGRHCAALKNDGSLWTWGNNNDGQLGLGYRDEDLNGANPIPTKVMDGVISVYAFGNTTFAIKEDHTLYAWGGDVAAPCIPTRVACDVPEIQDVVWLHVDTYQLLAADGRAFSYDARTGATAEVATQVQSLCSLGHIKKDGSLWIWDKLHGTQTFSDLLDNVTCAQNGSSQYSLAVHTDGDIVLLDREHNKPNTLGSLEKLVPTDSTHILRLLFVVIPLAVCGVILFVVLRKRRK